MTKYYGGRGLCARTRVSRADDAVKTHVMADSKLPCYCPWKEHLFELERERGTDPLPKYALFQDDKGQRRIQAIPPRQPLRTEASARGGRACATRRWTR